MEDTIPTQQTFSKAPISKRVFAACIDCGLIPLFAAFIISVLLILIPGSLRNFLVLFMSIAWFSFKDTFFEGAGPGKKIFGLRVISKATGKKITAGQGFIRNVLLLLPIISIIGVPLEFFILLLKGERFGDKWAGTKVVTN